MARRRRLVIALSMVVLGACGMIYEFLLGLIGNYLIGGRYEQILLIVGVMLFAMGLGAALQQLVTAHLVERFLLLELLLGLGGGFAIMLIYALFSLGYGHGVATYAAAGGVGLVIGMEIPLLMRINQTYAPELGENAGQLLALDNFGALAGALFFVGLLLTHVSLPRLGFALGLCNTAVAAVAFWAFRAELRTPRRLGVAIALVALLLVVGLLAANAWQRRLEHTSTIDPRPAPGRAAAEIPSSHGEAPCAARA